MAENPRKCAHPGCECPVTGSSEYCSDACEEAGSLEDEPCTCGHPACVSAQETAA